MCSSDVERSSSKGAAARGLKPHAVAICSREGVEAKPRRVPETGQSGRSCNSAASVAATQGSSSPRHLDARPAACSTPHRGHDATSNRWTIRALCMGELCCDWKCFGFESRCEQTIFRDVTATPGGFTSALCLVAGACAAAETCAGLLLWLKLISHITSYIVCYPWSAQLSGVRRSRCIITRVYNRLCLWSAQQALRLS